MIFYAILSRVLGLNECREVSNVAVPSRHMHACESLERHIADGSQTDSIHLLVVIGSLGSDAHLGRW